jgi:ABC-type Mn2+/Zn2+ transport system ATPase subunit
VTPHPHPRWPYTRHRHADALIFPAAVQVHALQFRYPQSSICGPNGAGKSTILKILASLLKPTAGTAQVFGLPLGDCRHRTAYLPQRGDVNWRFPIRVRRAVLAGRFVHLGWFRGPGKIDFQLADRALDRLGLLDLAEKPLSELSGGQQQRVLLARALCQGADLLLFDEPFAALDSETTAELKAVFAELTAGGKTLVVATHESDRTGYDAVLELRGGRAC